MKVLKATIAALAFWHAQAKLGAMGLHGGGADGVQEEHLDGSKVGGTFRGIAGGDREYISRGLQSSSTRTITKALASILRSSYTCKSFPDDLKECFMNDEDSKYGLAACDPSAVVFDEEACCARTVGLKTCLGEDVTFECDLLESFENLVHASSCGMSFFDETSPTPPSERTERVEIKNSMDGDYLEIILEETGMSLVEFRGKIDEYLDEELVAAVGLDHGHRDLGLWAMVPALATLLIAILKAVQLVISTWLNENAMREAFTAETVRLCRERLPDYSCVTVWDGIHHWVSGDYWGRQHHYLDVGWGRGFSYYLYATQNFKPFTFNKNGDGGYLNWAYDGYFDRTSDAEITTNGQGWKGARVFEHSDYGGFVSYLSQGGWDGHVFTFPNDAITSWEVDSGYCIWVYEHSNYSGEYGHACFSTSYVGDYWNDKISSVIVTVS